VPDRQQAPGPTLRRVPAQLHASAYEGISDGGSYTVFDTPWGARVGILTYLDNNIVENVDDAAAG
jgi:hypothetical protein